MTWLQAKSFFGPPLFEILILLIDPNEFPEARWKRWQQSLYKVPVYTVCCFQARARTDKHQSSTQTAWQIWRGDMSHMLVIPLLLYYLSMAWPCLNTCTVSPDAWKLHFLLQRAGLFYQRLRDKASDSHMFADIKHVCYSIHEFSVSFYLFSTRDAGFYSPLPRTLWFYF